MNMALTYRFDSDDDAREEIKMLNSAVDMSLTLNEIDQYCRGVLKHDDKCTEDIAVHLERIRGIVSELRCNTGLEI